MIGVFFLFSSFQKKSLTPFSFFNNEKTLVFRKSVFPKSFIDTLNGVDIGKLSQLQFEKKNFEVENYGVTPNYSVSVFNTDNGAEICLIAVWDIGNNRIAININHLIKEKIYYGYVIEEKKFENIFNFKKTREETLEDLLKKTNSN